MTMTRLGGTAGCPSWQHCMPPPTWEPKLLLSVPLALGSKAPAPQLCISDPCALGVPILVASGGGRSPKRLRKALPQEAGHWPLGPGPWGGPGPSFSVFLPGAPAPCLVTVESAMGAGPHPCIHVVNGSFLDLNLPGKWPQFSGRGKEALGTFQLPFHTDAAFSVPQRVESQFLAGEPAWFSPLGVGWGCPCPPTPFPEVAPRQVRGLVRVLRLPGDLWE